MAYAEPTYLSTKNTGDSVPAADINAITTALQQLWDDIDTYIAGNSGGAPTQTLTELIAAASIPAGTIAEYGGAAAPSGWLLCDGSAVSRSTYSSLFTAISTTYGAGDSSSTFNIPDFRGVFPKGAGTTNRAAGKDAANNYYTSTLGAYSTDIFQGHVFVTSDSFASPTPVYGNLSDTNGTRGVWYNTTTAATGSLTSGPKTDSTNGTPRTGTLTEPQNLSVSFIIKY